MGRIQQSVRQQHKLQDLCSTTLRALGAEGDLQLRAQSLFYGQQRVTVHVPHLKLPVEDIQLSDYRGMSDGMAVHWRYSNRELYRSLCPQDAIQRLIFELLEQLRVESLVPDEWPGVKQNLRQRFVQWSLNFHHSGLSDTALGLLLYTVAQMVWARVQACAVLEETEDFIEATRAGIAPIIGHDLALLKKYQENQAAYAQAALRIAKSIEGLISQARTEQDGEQSATDDSLNEFKLLLDFDEADEQAISSASTGLSKVFTEADDNYRIFTTRYDREVAASSLVRTELLRELRKRLDKHIAQQSINVTRIARYLAVLFAQPQTDGWNFGEEEGLIDGRRLAQLVTSPTERRLFQQTRFQPKTDTVVSLLIDCSGSMREHIDQVALLIDVFCRALHLAGVSSEVLGFTTGGWNGGRAQRDWFAKGRPKHPGRLNEVTYMIYKEADTHWRRARASLSAMLKPDLFREGIDGEAVDWACQRLRQRPEQRRVLLVISDGCPMDTATNLANDAFYLDNHLKAVVARREQQGEVEIYGLGVGLDLSPFYSRYLALDLSKGVGNETFNEILQLFRN